MSRRGGEREGGRAYLVDLALAEDVATVHILEFQVTRHLFRRKMCACV